MSSPQPDIVRLEFCSAFDMLDFVQVVGDHLCRRARALTKTRCIG